MAQAAQQAGVKIICGDTKVVEKGKGDGVFITTTGIGVVPTGVNISGDQARVMADKPVMFQSSICTANGEIVITCHGATALVSPRRARPGSMCAKG